MPNAHKVFLFNSGLPESKSVPDLLLSMGPRLNKIRGQNIGNGYISYGFLNAVFGRPSKIDHLSNAWDHELPDQLADEINEGYSHLLFVMQDFIRASFHVLPFDRLTRFLEKIKIPVVPLSLGANALGDYDLGLARLLSADQKRFFAVVSEKSKAIGVRGNYSAEVLNELGIKNARAIGCPSYFSNGPTRVLSKKAWDPGKVITTAAFFNYDLPDTTHLLQDELYFINLLYLDLALGPNANVTGRIFNPDDISASFHMLAKARAGRLKFFSDYNQWADFLKGGDFCFTIGQRLHSAIFSMNCGIPAVVTSPDTRSRETCEYLGIPHDPSIHSRSDVRSVFEDLDVEATNASYPLLYEQFRAYLDDHGLSSYGEGPSCFEFPRLQENAGPSVQAALQDAYYELAEAVEKEVITLRAFGGNAAARAADRLRSLTQRNPEMSLGTYIEYLNRL